jgi:hypothetical protein
MTEKQFLEAVDFIYKKFEENGSEGRLNDVQDALYALMVEYKTGLIVFEWKTAFKD